MRSGNAYKSRGARLAAKLKKAKLVTDDGDGLEPTKKGRMTLAKREST